MTNRLEIDCYIEANVKLPMTLSDYERRQIVEMGKVPRRICRMIGGMLANGIVIEQDRITGPWAITDISDADAPDFSIHAEFYPKEGK